MISGEWPDRSFACEAVVRYRGAPASAVVQLGSPGSGMASIEFTGDGLIASPGQAVVFYQGDEVLGGGTIAQVARVSRTEPALVGAVRYARTAQCVHK